MQYKDLQPQKFTVLVVDDAEPNLVLIKHVLSTAGYQYLLAHNAEEAVEILKETEPDLILMDVIMPGMNGFELTEAIRKKKISDAPVIYLSGAKEAETVVKAFDTGGVDYINKPFVKDEILARIKTHLSLAQLQKDLQGRLELIKERETQLSELNKQKDQLIRMVSHDIKNPLTGIIGIIQILREESELDKEEQMTMLNLIDQGAQELFEIVKQQLDMQQVESEEENDPFNPTEISLNTLIKRALDRYRLDAESKDVSISFESDEENKIIRADEEKLNTLFQIMISNAVRYNLDKGNVTVRMFNLNSEEIRIEIHDTGIGIPTAILKHFLISDDPEREPDPSAVLGVNVGLDIVRRIVELHKGKIWVNSVENAGTTFFINLPVK